MRACHILFLDLISRLNGGDERRLNPKMNLSMVKPIPVVIWHGLTNDCCHEIEGRDKGIIEKEIPGIYVRSLQIPDPNDLPGNMQKNFIPN